MAEKKPARGTQKPGYDRMHTESPLWPEIDEVLRREIGRRRPSRKLKNRAIKAADLLAEEFPGAFCALNFNSPLQLLVATILSAQCTDERVNQVTPELFRKFPAARDLAEAPPGALEEAIRSTGFFNNKAKAIRGAAETIVRDFGGEVPRTMEELLTLRGAARKTANVVRMHAHGLPGISVDTHFSRITQRLGLTEETNPEKIEYDIAAMLPPERWTKFADSVILHGRKTCNARSPKCSECRLAAICPSAGLFEKAPAKPKVRSPR